MLLGDRELHILNGFDLSGGHFDPPLAYQEPKEIPRPDPKCAIMPHPPLKQTIGCHKGLGLFNLLF